MSCYQPRRYTPDPFGFSFISSASERTLPPAASIFSRAPALTLYAATSCLAETSPLPSNLPGTRTVTPSGQWRLKRLRFGCAQLLRLLERRSATSRHRGAPVSRDCAFKSPIKSTRFGFVLLTGLLIWLPRCFRSKSPTDHPVMKAPTRELSRSRRSRPFFEDFIRVKFHP